MTTLVEKMCEAWRDASDGAYLPWKEVHDFDGGIKQHERKQMRAALAVVRAHDSDPANVTDAMLRALQSEARFRMIGEESDDDYHRRALAAAMKAVLTES